MNFKFLCCTLKGVLNSFELPCRLVTLVIFNLSCFQAPGKGQPLPHKVKTRQGADKVLPDWFKLFW